MSTGLIDRALGQVRQFVCGMHGHDVLLHFEEDRMSLQCTSCGYETPGWEVKATAPRPVPMREAARRDSTKVVTMPAVHERRVA